MKKILLLVTALLFLSTSMKLHAQCIVSNVGVNVKSFNKTSCEVVFDLTWEQEVNGGNKFAYFHLWLKDNYHQPATNWNNMYKNPSASPNAADLNRSLGTIVINDNGTPSPKIGTNYSPATGVNVLSAGLTIEKSFISSTRERMTIKNIRLTFASCSGVITLKGDVWASQAANGANVHCAFQGLTFNLNNPEVSGFKVCEPRSYSYRILNNGTAPITVHYNLYKDDGDGTFEPGTAAGSDGLPIFTSPSYTLAPGASQSQSRVAYPGNNTPGETGSLWMEVITTVPAESFVALALLEDPGCIPLPVSLKSFTVKRVKSNVLLEWETTSETHNLGFELQRKIGGNHFEKIAFINSKADGGNSESNLFYSFNDVNNVKGISQYRLLQTDLDGKTKYSEIRSVKGEEQASKTIVYPNPSVNGKVNILFEDHAVQRNVFLSDMNGRLIKQWINWGNNSIQMDNLNPGFYNLRIVNRESGEQSFEKIVINKR